MASNDDVPPKSPPPPPPFKRRTGETPIASSKPTRRPTGETPIASSKPTRRPTGETPIASSKSTRRPTGETRRPTGETPLASSKPRAPEPKLPPPPRKRSTGETRAARPLPELKLELKQGRAKSSAPIKTDVHKPVASTPAPPTTKPQTTKPQQTTKTIERPARLPPLTPDQLQRRKAAQNRGNNVPPVAGVMTVDPEEEDRTMLMRAPDHALEDDETRTAAYRRPLPASDSQSVTIARAVLDAYEEEARSAITHFRNVLDGESDPERIGRFHYEIGRLNETVFGDLEAASNHYAKALEATPQRLPVIVGARRVLLARGHAQDALELFDRELRVTADRSAKAALMFVKARVLEDHLQQPEEARAVYESASDLVASDAVLIKAIEQADWTLEDWNHLASTYGQQANAVGSDARHRAALVVRRARQIEVHRDDADTAAQLYEDALDIDHRAPGALEALKRLHYERRRWRELIRVLETEGEMIRDSAVRVAVQYRVGQIHAERLGNRNEAIAAFEGAAREAPDQPFVLDALARLYERAGSHPALANTLTRLVESTTDARERLGYLHRIGELCRDELHDDEAAIGAYEAALEIDPTYVPALRSLAPMYASKDKWDQLVQMHEREAEATHDPTRRAVAHARAAEILERASRRVEAIVHHEHALALDATLASSFRALLRLYAVTEEHHKLIELYERAIDRCEDQRRIEYLFAIGDLYRGPLADPERAESAYRRILNFEPKHLGAIHALQRTAEQAGRWQPLVSALERETEVIDDRRDIVALLYRAGCVLNEQLGKRTDAVARFKRVLELDPKHQSTLASLGRIYHAQGHWADLVEVYAQELGLGEPANEVALLHKMGDVYSRYLANPTKAVECFRKSLAIDPRHAPSSHALARIFADRSQWADLVELIEAEQTQAKDPASRAVAAFRAGEIYEEHLDDKAAAERAFGEAVELRPHDDATAEALARVRTQLAHWKQLAEELGHRAARSEDEQRAITLWLRAAEVWSDRVGSVEQSIACYEQVLARNADHVGALLGVEPLYRQAQNWTALADVYAGQIRVFSDPGAKAAALTERARILEIHRVGSVAELADCYFSLLTFRPSDRGVLEGLERIALASTDPRILADVDARLADAVADTELKSAYLTRQAEAMETSGQPQALEIYRQALRHDGGNRGAVRGLGRVAEVLGHGEAMVEAAEADASLAKEPRVAADAWVRAGLVHVDRLDDRIAGVRAFAKALALWPDHADAAERLTTLLSRTSDYEVLVERLSRAASEAKETSRQHVLWVEVSQIHHRELNNLGAALSALRKLVDAQPGNGEAMFELGSLLHSDRRFEEAIGLLERSLQAEGTIAAQAHTLLANSHEALGESERAFTHYAKALELAPDDHELLQRVVNLQMADELFDEAVETATRLVQVARNDAERCRSLVLLARAKHQGGATDIALEHLAEAVVLEGPRGRARAEVTRIAQSDALWQGYVKALRAQLGRRELDEDTPTLFHEIAKVELERLDSPEASMKTLASGLHECGSAPVLRYALASQLHDTGRHGEAVEQFQYLLMEEVDRADAWRGLSDAYACGGQERERTMALASVAVLGSATAADHAVIGTWRPRTKAIGANMLREDMLAEVVVAREQQTAAASMISAVAEGLSRVRAPDLARHGVSGRDKLSSRSEHPVRSLVDRLALSFGVEEFDLYLHHIVDRPAVVENTPRPSLVLPNWMLELPTAGQVFIVSHGLHMLARGLYPIDLLSTTDLELVLAASGRHAMPNYGGRVASAGILDERLKQILKGLPRKRRRAFDAATESYARTRPLDVATAVNWMRQTARRVALLVADDLGASLTALSRMEDLGAPLGAELVRDNPVVADLMKVWASKPAMTVRRRLGLIPSATTRGAPPPPPR